MTKYQTLQGADSAFSEFRNNPAAIGAGHTIPEILGQPDLWENTWHRLHENRETLTSFLSEAFQSPHREIILTGAGSSAFIGELLQGAFGQKTRRCVHAIATTDIVTHPGTCFPRDVPALLVSFARSGNSPESVAAIERADACFSDLRHLIITCNPDGALARCSTKHPRAVFSLPPEADDKGLAMTGSFTSMALAGLLLADLEHLDEGRAGTRHLASVARDLLEHQGSALRRISQLDFKRAIFLGAGPLKGAARECHLKLQELTNGSVMCSYDSFLGFRHGPKAAIDTSTLLVFLFSGSSGNTAYEQDLVREIRSGSLGLFRLGIGEGLSPHEPQEETIAPEGYNALSDDERAICGVLPAQILGVHRSLRLGLNPDNPSPSGSISRVVQGVTIYPMDSAERSRK